VIVHAGDIAVAGDLVMPDDPHGVVLFAHGSGSSRHSPRNKAVASGLNEAGFGTLLMDLLTADEERYDAETAELRFDITLLTSRLSGAIDWLAGEPATSGLPLGLFGASTGAAAALAAAAVRSDRVAAVVSRGGRPDLAGPWLGQVRKPVLLIVGGRDVQVAQWNREAGRRLAGPIEIRVVVGASHLFEEPGALEQVTTLAAEWFRQHLRGAPAPVTLPPMSLPSPPPRLPAGSPARLATWSMAHQPRTAAESMVRSSHKNVVNGPIDHVRRRVSNPAIHAT
jgi:putative phosphoribosyl transferase